MSSWIIWGSLREVGNSPCLRQILFFCLHKCSTSRNKKPTYKTRLKSVIIIEKTYNLPYNIIYKNIISCAHCKLIKYNPLQWIHTQIYNLKLITRYSTVKIIYTKDIYFTVSHVPESFRLLHSRVQSSFFNTVSIPGKFLQSSGNSNEIFSLASRIDVICRFPFLVDSYNTI